MDKMHAFEDELTAFDNELAAIMGKSGAPVQDQHIYGVSKDGDDLQVGTMMPSSGEQI